MAEYMRSLMGETLPIPEFTAKNTALILIDVQYGSADLNLHTKENQDRLKRVFLNLQRLQAKFRRKSMEIIFIRAKTLTKDGRERSLPDKDTGRIWFGRVAEVVEDVKPIGDEIVVNKSSSSAFNSTSIDYYLRNIGIKCVIITGLLTSMCVEATVRDASKRGYSVVLVEDATLNFNPQYQKISIRKMKGIYATIMKTNDVLRRV